VVEAIFIVTAISESGEMADSNRLHSWQHLVPAVSAAWIPCAWWMKICQLKPSLSFFVSFMTLPCLLRVKKHPSC
jgi:hypothetical protein